MRRNYLKLWSNNYVENDLQNISNYICEYYCSHITYLYTPQTGSPGVVAHMGWSMAMTVNESPHCYMWKRRKWIK